MEVRGGMSYYHNVATAQGAGLNTSTEVGIPNANLDDYTSGISRIVIGATTGGFTRRSLVSRRACPGIAPSGPGTSRRR